MREYLIYSFISETNKYELYLILYIYIVCQSILLHLLIDVNEKQEKEDESATHAKHLWAARCAHVQMQSQR